MTSEETQVRKMYWNAVAVQLSNGDLAIHNGKDQWLSLSRGWSAALYNIEKGELGANERPLIAAVER